MRAVRNPHVADLTRNASNANKRSSAQQSVNVISHCCVNRKAGEGGKNVAVSVRREAIKAKREVAIITALNNKAETGRLVCDAPR